MDPATILASPGVKRLGQMLLPFGIRLIEPMLIKKTAEARVAELRLLTDAISEAERELPEGTTIKYNKEGLNIVTKTNPKARAILDRAGARLLATELIQQLDLENVIAEATAELKDLNEVPDQDPEPAWTMRFLGYAEGMGDPYLQELWGKVLAGEIQKPGSYSLRTLDVLSAMTQKEAELFVEACKYLVWNTGGALFVPRDVHSFLRGSTLSYGAFSHLAEIGMFFQGDIGIHPFRLGGEVTYFGFSDGTALAVTQGQPRPRVETGLNIWLLTQSGRDLLRFCSWETPNEYVENFRDSIRKLSNWDSRVGKITDYSNPKFEENN